MKKMLKTTFFALAIVATSLAAGVLTADGLLKDADKHDGKVVTVKGSVLDFKQKTSKKGNPYFTFKLATKSKENPLNVYGQGTLNLELKDKAKVEITGKFVKEKTVGNATYKNEVDVTAKSKDDKPGVKLIEAGK